MSSSADPTAPPPGSLESLESLAAVAFALEPLAPHERRGLLRSEAGELLDRLLVRVAQSQGALDVALCEGLAALSQGDRLLRLGYSCLEDHARERLGIAGRTAQSLARLGRALPERPLLRAALRGGQVSLRKAQAVLPVARGAGEAAWVLRAGRETVRALEAAVRGELAVAGHGAAGAQAGEAADARPGSTAPQPGAPADAEAAVGEAAAPCPPPPADASPPPAEDEAWHRVRIFLSPEGRATVDEALELAGRLLGPAAPTWQRVEAICQEYLGAHGPEAEDAEPAGREEARWRAELERLLEEEHGRWAWLDELTGSGPAPAAPPLASLASPDDALPRRLDAELGQLAALRDRWDELVGHLGLLLRSLGLWRDMGFVSFAHYCRDRLQLPVRSVEQRIWLERRLYYLPGLRQAMREGRIGYEKARVLAGAAGEDDVQDWLGKAERLTCIALRREVEAREKAAQPRAEGRLVLRMPARVAGLLGATLRTAREVVRREEGLWLGEGECLVRVAAHFVATWKELPRGRSTPQRRAIERDRGLCQVPGCSRAAAHAHHVLYRSQGGDDGQENLVALCAAHHLHGVHRGWVRVRGRAPDALIWELGEVEGRAA